ncbi:hypothetical protein M446_6895 [Methylobacterium sp. 4-46]|nr:hypothetical protein M446_6895 [Methylobacterium sp. 4-46]
MSSRSPSDVRLLVYGERRCSGPSAPALAAARATMVGVQAAGLAGIVDVILTVRDDVTLEISFVATLRERRKGHAGQAIGIISRAADATGVMLILKAQGCPPKGARRVLGTNELVRFYERRGFRVVSAAYGGGVLMERPPKRQKPVSRCAA